MNKYTPGPWFWSPGVDDWELVGADANRVLFCWSDRTKWKGGLVVGESIKEADAKLIAASPDMAEALKAARQFIRNGIEFGYIRMPDADTPDSAHGTLPLIDAALAKAGVE